MASVENMHHQFSSMGVVLSVGVLEKCVDICNKYSLDEGEFVETWMAYSLTHLSGASPTPEGLLQMEKKELNKTNTMCTPKQDKRNPREMPNDSGTPKRSSAFSDFESPARTMNMSPTTLTPSTKYSARKDAGKCVNTYLDSSSDFVGSLEEQPFTITKFISPQDEKWQYYHETLRHSSLIIQDVAEDIKETLIAKNNLPEPCLKSPSEESILIGRIYCEDGRMSLGNVVIEGMCPVEGRFDIDMSGMGKFALFPGQVLAIKGKLVERKIICSAIFTDATQEQPSTVPSFTKPFHIMIAAGPFTQMDSWSYDPLHDFADVVREKRPDILILVGPIVDSSHELISTGDVNETFSEIYVRLLKSFKQSLGDIKTKVFYIASVRDAFNIPIYPTPGVNVDNTVDVTTFPDPSLFEINGLSIGITSTDILFHLGKRGLSCGGNRLARISQHVLEQQNFYPLYPPDPDLGLDIHLWGQFSRLTFSPHILILPSDLHHIITHHNGTLIINPERLTKGQAGGMFTLLEVKPRVSDEVWTPATHIAIKMLKI